MSMKFTVATKKKSESMDEGKFQALMECMEQRLDAIDNEDQGIGEVLENLRDLRNLIKQNPEAAKKFVLQDVELAASFDGSMENFASMLNARIDDITTRHGVATEGFWKDLLWEGPLVAIIRRNDHKLEQLRPAIRAAISRVEEASDKNFEQWRVFKQISVFSKYLPDQKEFAKCADALLKAMKLLEGTKPGEFDIESLRKCFTGTVYMKNNGKINTSTTNPGVETNPLIFLICVAYTEDIRLRGWVGKKVFLDALNKCISVMDEMEKLAKKLRQDLQVPVDKDAQKTAKQYAKMAGEVINLSGHLCRGIASAARRVGGSIWERLFPIDG